MIQPAKSLPQRIILAGKYCRLEPLDVAKHGDDLWLETGKDDEIWSYLPFGPWKNRDHFFEWLKLWSDDNKSRCYYTIVDQNNKSLGALCLMDFNQDHATIELGGVFFSRKLQKTTIATEAVFLLSNYTFENLGFRRLQWRCNTKNISSEKAAKRFGFIFEGTLRNHWIVKGESRDSHFFSITDSEWPTRKKEFESWLDEKNFSADGKQIKRLEDFRN